MIKVDETDPVGELEPSFPYRDVHIRRNTDVKQFYDLQIEIGRGKFGTVFRCREKDSGLALAAKFVSVDRKEDRRNVEREVDIMRSLQHPRLLQLYDAFEYEKTVCLILELIEGGELFERVIDDDFVLTEKACTIFVRQICEGIQFMHQQHILHLDLKPENILCLTKAGNRIKIIDFGLARRYEPNKKLQVLFGTPEFVAPEVVNFDPIGFNTDMWSVGVICYVLLSGLSPFMGDTDIETMANVTVAKYDFDDEVFNDISDDAKDFIGQLLVKEKENRMCAEACLCHRWLRRKRTIPKAVIKATTTAASLVAEVPSAVDTPPEVNNNIVTEKDKNAAAECPSPAVVNGAQDCVAEVGKLEGAKDNLKSTVERWTEHPDSPYIFDTTAHIISPCPSLANVFHEGSKDTEAEDVEDDAEHSSVPHPYDRLLGSERRASDSNCFVRLKSHHHLDVHDRINLADEIRELSEKLFRMAAWAPRPAVRELSLAATCTTDDGKQTTDLAPTADDGKQTTNASTTVDHGRQTTDRQHVASPLVDNDENVESMTVLETVKGRTTTKTTFRCPSKRTEDSPSNRLSDNFAVRLSQSQIPTKRFWPIEPGRMPTRSELQDDDISPAEEALALASSLSRRDSRRLSVRQHASGQNAFHRLSSRSLSSASASSATSRTHSAPQSPRLSPDPELPPPPSSDLTKDLLLRLLHRLSAGSSPSTAQCPQAPHHHSLFGLGHGLVGGIGDPHWLEDPFFRREANHKKRTLIASHGGGP